MKKANKTRNNRTLTEVVVIPVSIVFLVVGIIACNERNHSYEKAVEKMHQETARPATSDTTPAKELPKINPGMSWTDSKPTNAPICVAPQENSK